MRESGKGGEMFWGNKVHEPGVQGIPQDDRCRQDTWLRGEAPCGYQLPSGREVHEKRHVTERRKEHAEHLQKQKLFPPQIQLDENN